jgi:hypothetical protein
MLNDMATPKKRKQRKRKVTIKSRARIKNKNSKTLDSIGFDKAPTKLVDDNGANFKIKIKRKR